MKEIVEKLHENRQVELAKQILESNGYKVTKKSKKKLNESSEGIVKKDGMYYASKSTAREVIKDYQEILDAPEDYGYDEYPEMIELIEKAIDICRDNDDAVMYDDISPWTYKMEEDIVDTGNDYIYTGYVTDEEGNNYQGYFIGNRDGYMSFLHIPSADVRESQEERLKSMRGRRVKGIADYGTELWNEFLELQDTDPRVEELVTELGFNWFDDESEEEPAEDEIMKVLLAYYKEKAK